jgi:16S rRNA (adenine1518-N6/adenine1519-N6)-dimethyltransferase
VEHQSFFKVVRAAFAQRRKTLHNTLSKGLGIPKEEVVSVLLAAGINGELRAEDLSILDFQKIVRALNSEG